MRPRRTRGRAVRWRGHAGALLCVAVACAPEPAEVEFPKNHCVTNADCWSDTTCNTDLGLCAMNAMEQPYKVMFQISPNPNSTAGRYTWPVTLEEAPTAPLDVVVPPFVEVQGLISCEGKAIMAEVVFFPRSTAGYPIAPLQVLSSDKDPAATTNMAVRLPPNTTFDVNIQPVRTASTTCPPQRATLPVDGTSVRFDPPAPELIPFKAKLVEDRPLNPEQPTLRQVNLRVRSKSLRRIVSATVPAQVGATDPFVVKLLAPMKPEDGVLQVDLNPEQPWSEVLEYPVQALGDRSNDIRVPRIPATVRWYGAVEFGPADQVQRIPFTELLFTSYFPLPANAGFDMDWCQLRRLSNDPSKVVCMAERRVTTDVSGAFEINLLPGQYNVVIAPGSRDATGRAVNLATMREPIAVQPPPEGTPGDRSQSYGFKNLVGAAEVEGIVKDRDGQLLPNVNVQSIVVASGNTSGVGAFNRPSSAFTDARGEFTLPLDTGRYDVIAEPPKDSGYPLLYIANRDFDVEKDKTPFYTTSKLLPPLVVTGKVSGGPAALGLPNAKIDAYGLVLDVRNDNAVRPVLIGSAQCDAEGKFVLLLPPKIDDVSQTPSPTTP